MHSELASGVRQASMASHWNTSAPRPHRAAERLPLDFVKIDGTLMQAARGRDPGEKVRALVEAARRKVATIASG
jgi:hypothetical protein